jgi:hypothetical protein
MDDSSMAAAIEFSRVEGMRYTSRCSAQEVRTQSERGEGLRWAACRRSVLESSSKVAGIRTDISLEVHREAILVNHNDPPPPVFPQVLIPKEDENLCFDTLLEVLILNGLRVRFLCLQEGNGVEWRGPGGMRRTTWRRAIVS